MSDKMTAALVSQRDQAKESVMLFVGKHLLGGEPSEDLIFLLCKLADDSNAAEDDSNTALVSILAAYGILTAIIEYQERQAVKNDPPGPPDPPCEATRRDFG